MDDNPLPNIVLRLNQEKILENDEDNPGFEEALRLDLECLGKEPSDDELIEDEKRRNDVGQDEGKSGREVPKD